MKKLIIFFFFIFVSTANGHPFGIGENKVDKNFSCTGIKNLGLEIKFGFKEYNYKKDDSKFIISVSFNNNTNSYNSPFSGVYEFGAYKLENEIFDNMQMWFSHGYSGSEIYIFRYALVEQNNNYILNKSYFKINELTYKRLDNLKKRISKKSIKNYDKVANLIKRYGNTAFSYILSNSEENFYKNFKLKCTLE